MKRDSRIQRLSSEHHAALVLCLRIARACREGAADRAFIEEVRRRFLAEISPHLVREELLLLPGLKVAGEGALAARVLDEHRELRRLVERLHQGEALRAFSELLRAHVRFEERELFPCCERRLDDELLDRLVEA